MKQRLKKKLDKIKKRMLKALEKTGKQFYDEKGKEITTEEFVQLILKQKQSAIKNFFNKIKRGII